MYNMCAIKASGAMWTWGAATSGQLGNNTTTSVSSPVAVVGSHVFNRCTMQCDSGSIPTNTTGGGLKSSDGSIWMWGYNNSGQIGNNTTTSYSSPVAVVGSHSFVSLYVTGYTAAGRKADGSVWTWGTATSGVLGNNTTTNVSSPVAVVGSHSFIQLTSGQSGTHFLALKADGSVWTWGLNSSGQLGDNTVTARSSPVAVVGGHVFTKIMGGLFHSMALKSDGSMWCWGANDTGQLGDNTRTNTSSPVAVVGNHSFQFVTGCYSHSVGLKEDGSVWSWGRGANGQIGNNTTTSYSSPVAVVGSHSFIQVATARSAVAGLKASGEIWTWGYNGYGQLGDNTRTDKSSPVLVVGSHSFIQLWNQHLTAAIVTTIQGFTNVIYMFDD